MLSPGERFVALLRQECSKTFPSGSPEGSDHDFIVIP